MAQFKAQPGRLTIGGVICNPDGTIKQSISLTSRVPDTLRRRLLRFFPCELRHDNAARNVMADTLVDLFDLGSTNPEGKIKIYTTGGITLLATILMANPAFDSAVAGVADALGLPWSDPLASGSGLAAEFIALDRDEAVILTGAVTVSGGEMNFPQLEVAVNDIVKLLSVSYTAPP